MDLIAQLDALDASIAARQAEVERLEQDYAPTEKNFRYNLTLEIPFEPLGVFDAVPRLEVSKSFVVKKDTRFYVKSLEYAVTIQGTYGAFPDQVAAVVTLPPAIAQFLVQFLWKVRDTGSDREWQNGYLPTGMLGSTHVNGFRFGRGHAVLSGGSEVILTLGVQFASDAFGLIFGISDVRAVQIQFHFVGVEVPA